MNASPLVQIIKTIDGINEWIGRTVSWLTLVMVLITFVIVILRYLFNIGWIAMQESVTYMHALVFMLGGAYTLLHNGHVRVDIFYQGMSHRGQAWANLIGTLFLLLPLCGFICWVSWEYIAASWSVMETSQEAGGIPAVFLLKSVIPVMAALMVLQGISLALSSLLTIMGAEPDSDLSGKVQP
jgi:TRAP-type mannitol/chloroaromatic compound transport system permease small subunit